MEGVLLKNSQRTEEALYLTADAAKVVDMENFLPTEVIIERMLSWFVINNFAVKNYTSCRWQARYGETGISTGRS